MGWLIGGLFAAALGGIFSATSTRSTNKTNKEIAAESNELQREMFDEQMAYERETRDENWLRQDTMFTRAKADLVNAGYSPLALQGVSPSDGTVSSNAPAVPPQVVPGMMESPLSGISDAFSGIGDMMMQQGFTGENQKTKLDYDLIRSQKQFDNANQLLKTKLKGDLDKQDRQLYADMLKFSQTMQMDSKDLSMRSAISRDLMVVQQMNSITGGEFSSPYQVFYGDDANGYNDYLNAWKQFGFTWDEVCTVLKDMPDSSSSGWNAGADFGHSSSQSQGSFSSPAGEFKKPSLASALGIDVGVDFGTNKGTNQSSRVRSEIKRIFGKGDVKIPIYLPKRPYDAKDYYSGKEIDSFLKTLRH